jgi:hypothetical protein
MVARCQFILLDGRQCWLERDHTDLHSGCINDPPIDKIDHPNHYGGKDNTYEAIKVIRAYTLNFALGNTIKYILRAGKKANESTLDDLRKARWYLDNEIQELEKK